jgi:hypothetical protein
MDKRHGPRSPELRAKMAERRWNKGGERESLAAMWRDPEFLERERSRRRTAALKKLPSRFWRLVERSTDGCWHWKGSIDKKGYGRVMFPGKSERAHRVSWYLTHGAFPDSGVVLRHRCDTPGCVNPDHLEPGSDLANAHDRVLRNRTTQAKLTIEQVQEIRLLNGATTAELADRFGVGPGTIQGIRSGKRWRSVPWPETVE